jgi:hypothetical protein
VLAVADPPKLLHERFDLLALLEGGAGAVVQVALTGDVAVLKRVRPFVELAGTRLGPRDEVGNLAVELNEVAVPLASSKHRPHLSGRATGDIEVHQQLIRGPAFEALSDVVGDRQSRAGKLIGQIAGPAERAMFDQSIDPSRQLGRRLPDGQLLEAGVLHKSTLRH